MSSAPALSIPAEEGTPKMSQAAQPVFLLLCFPAVAASASKSPGNKTLSVQKRNRRRRNPVDGGAAAAKVVPASTSGFGGEKKEIQWQCVRGCGACCKLDKGPSFPSPGEIFEDPSDIQLFTSLIGPDGWCKHFEKSTRKCSIYADRPYFCRVEPDVFEALYGIDKKKFNKEACSCCVDTIKAVYGTRSEELENFNCTIRSSAAD